MSTPESNSFMARRGKTPKNQLVQDSIVVSNP